MRSQYSELDALYFQVYSDNELFYKPNDYSSSFDSVCIKNTKY